MLRDEYLKVISDNGLVNIKVQKEKVISIPDETLLAYLSQPEIDAFRKSGSGIYSITVYAEK
jgi:hypothetical protein